MSSRRFQLIGGAVLLMATFGAYVGVLWNELLEFDDNLYVIHNPHTAAGLSLAGFRYAWTTFESGNWIPITWLSFQLDSTLFGMGPTGFHVTNVVLHGTNVLLLFTWLVRVTGSRWRSAAVAAIFGLHPLHVESVAWVAERKDVLSTFWMLIALHAYERYAALPGAKWYLITCLAFALGLLSKSMLVTFPLLLLLVDFWPLGRLISNSSKKATTGRYTTRTFWRLVAEKIPLLGLSLIDGVVTMIAASHSTVFVRLKDSSLGPRIANSLHGYAWYIAKTFFPTKLIALYPYPPNGQPWDDVAISFILLVVISIYVAFHGRRRPYLIFGWLWFLISLLPVIGLLQVGTQAHADRYSYIPHIGLLLLIVWEASFWLNHLPASRSIAAFLFTTTVLILGWMTVCQVAVWRTSQTLWKHVLSIEPDNIFANSALAGLRLEAGEFDEASKNLQVVLRQRPELRNSMAKLVDIYRRYEGKPSERSQLRNELGFWFVGENDVETARIRFEQAVSLSPDNNSARYNLAIALIHLGRNQEAKSQLERVLQQDPSDASAHAALAELSEKDGQLASARDHFAAALKSKPNDEELQTKLKNVTQRLTPK